MSEHMDPDLQDVLRDPELMRFASILSASRMSDPPLDDAFKSGLRRQLMDQAWKKADGRSSIWRRLFAPQGLAWAGSVAMVVVVASVVVYTASQPSLPNDVVIVSPQQDKASVPLQQPILVAFNQPMDHQSTQDAVQITPATTVSYSWKDNTLYVQPTSGNLAPNTQYQVTIRPTALTAQQKPLSAPQSFTFVTQPVATPEPSPRPTPSPTGGLPGEQPLAPIPSGSYYTPQWSADSTTVYFIGQGGSLLAARAHGGPIATLVADGVSLPSGSLASRRIAFVRGGKVEVLDLGTSAIVELALPSPPQALRWVADTLYAATAEGVYSTSQSDQPLIRIASLPETAQPSVLSISPDGAHVVYQSATTLYLFETATGTSARLGELVGNGTTFQGWSADGTKVLYNGTVADMTGKTVTTLPSGDPSWSAQNQILLGSDIELDEVGSDGRVAIKLATGSYHLPAWAPDSTTFVFTRGSRLWVATVPGSASPQTDVDQASAVVTAFMQARLLRSTDTAASFLTDAGKAAFASGGPALIPSADLGFRRFYIVTAQQDPNASHQVRVVVRLVFAHGEKLERSAIDETLTLSEEPASGPFRVDSAAVGPSRALGKGPEVVAVRVTTGEVDITFDSDLVPSTVSGVLIEDAQGALVAGSATYADRILTIRGLQLTAGARYRVVVMPSVEDVIGRSAVAEYDLDVIAPAAAATVETQSPPTGSSPAPSPTPAATPGGTSP